MRTLKLRSKLMLGCIVMFCVTLVLAVLGLNKTLLANADSYEFEPTIVCKATLEDDFADNNKFKH